MKEGEERKRRRYCRREERKGKKGEENKGRRERCIRKERKGTETRNMKEGEGRRRG